MTPLLPAFTNRPSCSYLCVSMTLLKLSPWPWKFPSISAQPAQRSGNSFGKASSCLSEHCMFQAYSGHHTQLPMTGKSMSAGRWSVDIFSMFHLGRPDVLPVGDLGVRNGMKHLYNLKVNSWGACSCLQYQPRVSVHIPGACYEGIWESFNLF